jgi:hypothetical protein
MDCKINTFFNNHKDCLGFWPFRAYFRTLHNAAYFIICKLKFNKFSRPRRGYELVFVLNLFCSVQCIGSIGLMLRKIISIQLVCARVNNHNITHTRAPHAQMHNAFRVRSRADLINQNLPPRCTKLRSGNSSAS